MGNLGQNVDILLANYRDSRQEVVSLVQSFFRDVPIFLALLGVTAAGGLVNAPGLLLALPILVNFFLLYLAGKFRTVGLIGAYLIYLEEEINSAVDSPVMVWATVFTSRYLRVTARAGNVALSLVAFIFSLFYFGAWWWAYVSDAELLRGHPASMVAWVGVGATLLIATVVYLVAAIWLIRELSVERVRALVVASRPGQATKSP